MTIAQIRLAAAECCNNIGAKKALLLMEPSVEVETDGGHLNIGATYDYIYIDGSVVTYSSGDQYAGYDDSNFSTSSNFNYNEYDNSARCDISNFFYRHCRKVPDTFPVEEDRELPTIAEKIFACAETCGYYDHVAVFELPTHLKFKVLDKFHYIYKDGSLIVVEEEQLAMYREGCWANDRDTLLHNLEDYPKSERGNIKKFIGE